MIKARHKIKYGRNPAELSISMNHKGRWYQKIEKCNTRLQLDMNTIMKKVQASAHKQNFMISANNRQVSAFPAFFPKMTVYKRLLGVYKRF